MSLQPDRAYLRMFNAVVLDVWGGQQSESANLRVALEKRVAGLRHLDITFESGESIWTESSHKYRQNDVPAMLDRAGFSAIEQWVEDGFALTLAEAR